MIEKLDLIKEEYVRRYKERLSICYPSLGSTGFQERNQTNNFLSAAETIVPNLFTWFEFQIDGGKKNDNHLDAIAVDFNAKEIWLIESKRIQDQRKMNAIFSDKTRMEQLAKEPKKNFNRFYDEGIHLEEFSIYGLVLADVWNRKGQNDARSRAFELYSEAEKNNNETRRCHLIEIPIPASPSWQYRLIIDVTKLR